MQYIYAPWRNMLKAYKNYINKQHQICTFCQISKQIEQENQDYVLYHDEYCFIVMNKYPYTSGHFMLIPHQHVVSLLDLDSGVWEHISTLIPKATHLISQTLQTKHINIGINMGEYAGAGIPDHLHIHFVPRYKGDTNFITAIADARVYPNDFDEVFHLLKKEMGNFI